MMKNFSRIADTIPGCVAAVSLAAVLATSGGAHADDGQDTATAQAQAVLFAQVVMSPSEVATELTARGYVITEQRRTLLGRILLTAENDVHVRELVIHPNTGEVLRDMVLRVKATGEANADARARDAREGEDGFRPGLGLGIDAGIGVGIGASAGGAGASGAAGVGAAAGRGN